MTSRATQETAMHPPRARKPLGILVSLLALTVLGGCVNTKYDVTGATLGPDDYRVRHPILINQQIATMDLPVGPDVPKLSTRMRGNITGFAQQYAIADASAMAIIVPSRSANERVATGIARQAADALVAAGVPRKQIDVRSYPAGAEEAEAPVRLAFARIAAHVDGCGQWPMEDGKMWMKTENRSYYNFGCATQQNLAAQVTNPLDLLYPRGMSPSDSTRRTAVLGKYEQGQNPSGEYKGLDKVDIATGVGGQ
jgi:pilus assembly protein CpaD